MKKILSVIALALSALVANVQAANILTITESGSGFDSISADYNGNPVVISLTGAEEGWTIELPGTFALASLGSVIVGEPADPSLVNEVLVGTSPTFLTWTGQLSAPPGGPFPNSVLLTAAGFFENEPFDLILQDIIATTTTPDGGATLGLLFASIAGLSVTRRFWSPRSTKA